MVKHIWSVLCRESVINNENNALSLMNIFEGLNVEIKKEAPKDIQINIPVQYEIVTLLRKDNQTKDEEVELKAMLLDPQSNEIAPPIIAHLTLNKNKPNYRHRIKCNGIKLTIEGEYKFILQLKQNTQEFETVSTIPIDIHINKQS